MSVYFRLCYINNLLVKFTIITICFTQMYNCIYLFVLQHFVCGEEVLFCQYVMHMLL